MAKEFLKAAVLAGIAGLAVIGTSSTADARSYLRCDPWGHHCVRVHCDWDGDRCWRQSRYNDWHLYRGRGHWVCNRHGDSCRWVYFPHRHPW